MNITNGITFYVTHVHVINPHCDTIEYLKLIDQIRILYVWLSIV